MSQTQNQKKYDLEDRTYVFARDTRDFIKKLNRTISNLEYGKQLIRSSGSIAANYIEASESLSKKDFLLRMKICRKEAKETRLWLKLIEGDLAEKEKLICEVNELMKIFGAIVTRSN